MALLERKIKTLYADKEEMRRVVEEQNRLMGFVPDLTVTVERMQARVAADLKAAGIRPEDCDASRAIIAAREGNSREDN